MRASMHEGDSAGVDATPTMFINGQKLDGSGAGRTRYELRSTRH